VDEVLPYPFLAIVGQAELKTALVLALINPQIGGVLLIGPYGVGKTTAVRGLLDVMPVVEVEETDEAGNPVKRRRPMRIIELPLNARMEDVVGGINERVALEQQRVLLEEGVLARAHRNVLYIDEVNLLDARVVDAILDAAAQGRTFVSARTHDAPLPLAIRADRFNEPAGRNPASADPGSFRIARMGSAADGSRSAAGDLPPCASFS
jgi:magnesium chelatase subunit I